MLDKSKKYKYDSRRVSQGDCFICLPKGDPYIKEALDKGVVEVIHLNRREFAINANQYFDNPTSKCCLIGVTGTNGKTSVATFIDQILTMFNKKVLVIGTLNSKLTTPESWDILEQISSHIESGGTHVILEVSSHGIDQDRVFGFDFDVKCLTNITQDHLDYHKTFENYKKTKMSFMLDYPGDSIFSDEVELISEKLIPQFVGEFHLKNVSTAVEICKSLGINEDDILSKLSLLKSPQGRFESIVLGQPFSIIVDFAHTPDALKHVLAEALKLVSGNKNRLKVVFGCGGDRDKKKRPLMAGIAEKYSSHIILTSDNSRSEQTKSIIDEIKQGIINPECIKFVNTNRAAAIGYAINSTKQDDIVVIAGKGHETRQYCRGFSYECNDIDIIHAEIIKKRLFQINQTWVLDKPDIDSDVLFVSKKIANENLTYLKFKRVLPTPSLSKIEQYLQKINGKKVLILENESRISIADLLILILKINCFSGCVEFLFDEKKSFEENLAGLTLVQQTSQPMIIRLNPNKFKKIKKITEIIQFDHIVIGDIYNDQQFIELPIIKFLSNILNDKNMSTVWCFENMNDISDLVEDRSNSYQFQKINSGCWVEYCQSVVENLIIKLGVYIINPREIMIRYLQAVSWYNKVFLKESERPAFVVNWNKNIIDLKQKLEFFILNTSKINCYILTDDDQLKIINELLVYRTLFGLKKMNIKLPNTINIDTVNLTNVEKVDSFKEILKKDQDCIHVIWKDSTKNTEDIMSELT